MKHNSTTTITAAITAALLTFGFVATTNAQQGGHAYTGHRYMAPMPVVAQPQRVVAAPAAQPDVVSVMRQRAEQLAKLGLPYVFGGSDPRDGGMDCSGCLMHLLSSVGFYNIPRTSYRQYEWLVANRTLKHTKKIPAKMGGINGIKAGDLIFWGGTYESGHKVSHVMLYLGQGRDGTHYMFGARGTSVTGLNGAGVDVHVLDAGFQENLIGYGTLPGLG